MAFANSFRDALPAVAATFSSAALVWFGNGLDPFWPALWFAPLPVLLYALRASAPRAAAVALLAWLTGCLNLWPYLHAQGAPFVAWLAIFSTAAFAFTLAVLLCRALAHRGRFAAALLSVPSTWVVYEFARNFATPHGTGGCIAYSQLSFLPFLQLASLTGPWGMSFVLMLFPASLAIGLHLLPTHRRRALHVAAVGTGVLAAVLIFGAVRLVVSEDAQTVVAGLVASDQTGGDLVAGGGAPTDRLLANYARYAEHLAAQGARVIVIPEKVGVVVDPDVPSADAPLQQLADRTDSTIIVGLVHVAGPVKYNEARIYAPGTPVRSYDKQHMLPPFESNLKPGTALTVLPEGAQTWGVAICKDMDFTPLSRAYGLAGAGLLLVPAWDFRIDRAWHGHIAIMRGVEDGFSVVRSSRDGNLTVSDPRGRILAETRSDSSPFATLLTRVPAVHHATLYLLWGDWFGWFSAASLSFALFRVVASQ